MSVWQALRFRNWRILVRITVLLLGVSLLTATTVTVFITQRAAQSLTQQMQNNLRGLAANTVRVLETDNGFDYSGFTEASRIAEFRQLLLNPDSSEAQEDAAISLQEIYLASPALLTMRVHDKQGNVLISTETSKETVSAKSLHAALQGEIVEEPIAFSPEYHYPVGRMIYPIRESTEPTSAVVGAVSLVYSLSNFDFLLRDTLDIFRGGASSALGKADLYAVNTDKLVILHSNPQVSALYNILGATTPTVRAYYNAPGALGAACPPEMDGNCDAAERTQREGLEELVGLQVLADEVAKVFSSGEVVTLRYCRPHDLGVMPTENCSFGVWQLAAITPVRMAATKQMLLAVIAEVPESAVLEAVAEQRASGFTIAAFVLPLAFLVAVLMARTIARPIRRLSTVAAEVERGQPLNEPVIAHVARRGDELGDLSRIFGEMVGALNARREELQTIYNIGTSISGSLDLNETLNYVVTSLRQVIPYDWAEISFYDAHRQQIIAQVAADHDSVEPADPQPINAMQGYLSYLLTQGSGVCVPDIAAFKGAVWQAGRQWDALQPRAYLGVPLKAKDKIIGVIEMISAQANGLTTDHLRVLESVAVQAAVALQNAQEVQVREAKLRQEIQELRIEIDEAKKTKQVAAITESEYFQHLQSRISDLRKRTKKQPSEATDPETNEAQQSAAKPKDA